MTLMRLITIKYFNRLTALLFINSLNNNYYIYTARRRIQCYSFLTPNPQFLSFFLSLAVLTHRSEVHTPTAARRPDYVTPAGGVSVFREPQERAREGNAVR